jgi:hypothetical protein
VREVTKDIPSVLDRVDRYQLLSEYACGFNNEFARSCLKDAVNAIKGHDDDEFRTVEQRIIDVAHRIDPEYSEALAEILDKDPARAGQRCAARARLIEKEIKKKMLDEAISPRELFIEKPEDLPKFAWNNLGALNASRIETVRLRHFREYLRIAASLPFRDAYPVYAWAIENANRRLCQSEHEKSTLRGMFHATMLNCELASRLAERTAGRINRRRQPPTERTTLVLPGERVAAVSQLKIWLQTNAVEYLKISDPYIGPCEVVEILRLVLATCPTILVEIVTSRKYLSDSGIQPPYEDAFIVAWRKVCDQDPPDCQIVVASLPNGSSPIHDRWWVSRDAGVRLGTSFNSLGSKVSELSCLSPEQKTTYESEIDNCLRLMMRGKDGSKIKFTSFNLQ